MQKLVVVLVLAMLALGMMQNRASAEPVYAVDTNNNLLLFDSNTPGTVGTIGTITGLQPGEQILGIDFRPASNLVTLYGLGSTNRLYTIDTTTGKATAVAGGPPFTLSGNAFGVDFNPVPDRVRVVSDANQNLRLNPNDGGLAGLDTPLSFASGDPNAGNDPTVVGAAYTNSFGVATTTTLFGIDSNLNILVRQGGVNVPPGTPSPNTGMLSTIGSLGVDTSEHVGFDISGISGLALASLTDAGGGSDLYTINLATGQATVVDDIGNGALTIRGIAVAAVPEPGSVTLLGLGVAGLLGYGWRRRRIVA